MDRSIRSVGGMGAGSSVIGLIAKTRYFSLAACAAARSASLSAPPARSITLLIPRFYSHVRSANHWDDMVFMCKRWTKKGTIWNGLFGLFERDLQTWREDAGLIRGRNISLPRLQGYG